jgi:two-component system, chemotaxis family, protein-glutamate methylesterase/glutaminase
MAATQRRIVLCDDSRTYATALARALEHDGSLAVVGVFPTAERAIAELPRLRPDLVTMDLALPGMSGLEAVEQIMASTPTPIVVVSDYTDRDAAGADAAVAAGAVAAIPKADLDLRDPAGVGAVSFRRRLKRLSSATVVRHPIARLAPRRVAAAGGRRAVAAIGVVASTGGPKALARLLGALPGSFPVPILVVQHIAAGFEAGLVRTLDRATDLPVAFAHDGTRPGRGVWVAPPGAHLTLGASGRVALVPPHGREAHCPSGDVLLASLARTFGPQAVAVVLTGMGADGVAGVGELSAAGGLAIAQDAASSAVFGMPRLALANGAELAAEPAEIARLLARLPFAATRPGVGTSPPPAGGQGRLRLVR